MPITWCRNTRAAPRKPQRWCLDLPDPGWSHAGTAESEVVRLFEQTSSSSDSTSPTFKPEVRYSVRGGATHTSTATWGINPPTYKVGEKVLVHYDPTAPASMMPDTVV
jgi:hypothetical protein